MNLRMRVVQTLESWIAEYISLPGLMRLGLVILLLGAALDMFYHLAPAGWVGTAEILLGRNGYNAHLVTLIGMLLMIAGLFQGLWLLRTRRIDHHR